MFSFKGYSKSGTNTHLEHLEDSIINDGAKRWQKMRLHF